MPCIYKKIKEKCNRSKNGSSLYQTNHLLSQQSENTELLLKQCLEGSQRAQLAIYNKYYKAMYNASLRIVKHTALAEDIMQDSFLSAFTKLSTFKGDVAFGAWLKRIVINNSIYHYRKNQKTGTVDLEDVMYRVEDDEVVATDTSGYTELKAQKVMETMKNLKDNYRVSLTLHLIEGYDYDEICEIMDISYANCRTTISRAKESLRKKLTVNV